MAVTIGSNTLSQTVQRQLSRATQDLSTSSERLSSGQRINKASDDAAGLAISTSLDKDRIISQAAKRNVNDGISVVSTLTSGIKAQKEILFRMAELSEQSANGTYTSVQREGLQKEYGALMDEFDRIADTTDFNGVKLLRNPTPQTIQFMAGITGSSASLLQVTAANSHRFAGVLTQKSDIDENGAVNSSDFINSRSTLADPRASVWRTIDPLRPHLYDDDIGDAAEVNYTDSLGRKGSLTFVVSRVQSDQGYETKYDPSSAMDVPVNATRQDIFGLATSATGETVAISTRIDSSGQLPQGYQLNFTFATSGATGSINIDLSGINLEFYDIAASSYRPSAIGFTNVLNQYAARRGLNIINNRIDDLSALEGQYGAVQSRLTIASNLLSTSSENLAAASSRIKDTDVAEESAKVVASGIRQQVAASLLGQANQAPQIALRLLQNA